MIELTADAESIIESGNQIRYVRVESWRGGTLLASDIPVATGLEITDRGQGVPEQVFLTVPKYENGYDWSPTNADHPLAAYGQRLKIELGIGIGQGEIEWVQRGWFVIHETQTVGDTVNVECKGLLTLIDEARFVSPFQPSGTFKSTVRSLTEPGLTVVFDDALTDRSVPSGINYSDSRLDALTAVLDAWPADGYVTEDGYLYVTAVAASVSVLELVDGVGGTVITTTGTSSREDAYNCVVAKGTSSDGGEVQAIVYDETGPTAYNSDFSDFPVPFYYESPLLTTKAQCRAAARTRLATIKRKTALSFEVEIVPHPALQAGDVVSLTTDEYTELLCSVETLTLPYHPDGGSQKLVVRELT